MTNKERPESVEPFLKAPQGIMRADHISLEDQRYLLNSPQSNIKYYLAFHKGLHLEIQEGLLAHGDWEVLTNLAQNKHLDPQILERLGRDSDSDVRGYVAKNPSVSRELLREFMSDSMRLIRRCASENESLEWTTDLPARFVDEFNPQFYDSFFTDEEYEVAKSLLDNWTDSLAKLIDASKLVMRD